MASSSSQAASMQRSQVCVVCFPGAEYTQASALEAARKVLQPRGWTVREYAEHDGNDAEEWVASQVKSLEGSDCMQLLYLMDYDLIPFDSVHPASQSSIGASGLSSSASSYPIRKALIRKNWLHNAVHAYSVKHSAQAKGKGKERAPLDYLPQTWSIDVQFADDLDELLIDDLFDLAEILEANEERDECDRRWFILKAGMADRGNGIRMFDSLESLRGILEEFEDGESDEEDEEQNDDDQRATNGDSGLLSQLRHFVLQSYVHPPLLIAPNPATRPSSFRKFHLRAYVLCVGGLKVYLADEMLALFAPKDYVTPASSKSAEMEATLPDVAVHLTNTCLHSDGSPTSNGRIASENVHLLSSLCRSSTPVSYLFPSSSPSSSYSSSDHNTQHLSLDTFKRLQSMAAETIGAVFTAVAKGASSTNWLTWPNTWEIFGVDLLVSSTASQSNRVQQQRDGWEMSLLEINAQPDFAQSGSELQSVIEGIFRRSIELAVVEEGAGGKAEEGEEEEERQEVKWRVGENRDGMILCVDERLRGAW